MELLIVFVLVALVILTAVVLILAFVFLRQTDKKIKEVQQKENRRSDL